MAEILYHYCGVEAFRSIIETGSIRLVNAACFNDHAEFTWFCNLVLDRLPLTAEKPFAPNVGGDTFAYCVHKYTSVLLAPVCNHFCFCMSRSRDLLSQWRAYANNGEGFTIGFDSDCLQSHVTWASLENVIYEESEQSALADDVIQQVFDIFASTDVAAEERVRRAVEHTGNRAIVCKNSGFREETEVRLVYCENDAIPGTNQLRPQFDVRGARLVTYYQARINPAAIKEIGFGPKNDYDVNLLAAKRLLLVRQCDVNEIDFFRANATYR